MYRQSRCSLLVTQQHAVCALFTLLLTAAGLHSCWPQQLQMQQQQQMPPALDLTQYQRQLKQQPQQLPPDQLQQPGQLDLKHQGQRRHHDYWCSEFPSTPFPVSLWYVKAPKSGSSTLTAVFNHICTRYGIVWVKEYVMATIMAKSYVSPTVWNDTSLVLLSEAVQKLQATVDNHYLAVTSHMPYSDGAASTFNYAPLWLFTSVRHPLPRFYSHYVQDLLISTARSMGWDEQVEDLTLHPDNFDFNAKLLEQVMQTDTTDRRWQYAREAEDVSRNFLFKYLKGSASTAEEVVNKYKFLFVVERMDESLVVFMLTYGLTFSDIAYVPLKQRHGKYKTAQEMPKELNDYILAHNQLDLQLWRLANQRLTTVRQNLEQRCGASTVSDALATFKQLKALLVKECVQHLDRWYKNNAHLNWFNGSEFRSANVASRSGEGYRCVRQVVQTFVSHM